MFYVAVLTLCAAFFLLSGFAVREFRRETQNREKRDLDFVIGPESEPSVVALYCQYLVAPETARLEASESLARMHGPQRAHTLADSASNDDFLTLLSRIQSRTPASTSLD